MFCKKCGRESKETQKFCTNCGVQFSNINQEEEQPSKKNMYKNIHQTKSSWSAGRIISILVVVVVIGIGIYYGGDDEAITKNNDGISSLDSGDTQAAINQFQQANQDVVSTEQKINILKNLAYAYYSEGEDELMLDTLKEALNLTKNNSVDYYLISGEIALLEYKPNSAILSFNKAYELDPTDFQINNSIALFYLDLEDNHPQSVDYQKAVYYAKRAYEYDDEKKEATRQNLAIAYYFNENFDQTISLLSGSNFIQHPYAAFWLGLAYLSKEDHLNAQTYLQKAINNGAEVPQEISDYLNSN